MKRILPSIKKRLYSTNFTEFFVWKYSYQHKKQFSPQKMSTFSLLTAKTNPISY